jgi:hypothetical protein
MPNALSHVVSQSLTKGWYERPWLAKKAIRRFWSKVKKGKPSDCWTWVAGKNPQGYGQFNVGVTNMGAHRFAYFISKGAIPKHLMVCHSCNNPACVNPRHLWLGTSVESANHCIAKGRHARQGPKNPAKGKLNGRHTHPESVLRGEQQSQAKLTKRDVISIRRSFAADKLTKVKIAKQYGITRTRVWQIVTRKCWTHI